MLLISVIWTGLSPDDVNGPRVMPIPGFTYFYGLFAAYLYYFLLIRLSLLAALVVPAFWLLTTGLFIILEALINRERGDPHLFRVFRIQTAFALLMMIPFALVSTIVHR